MPKESETVFNVGGQEGEATGNEAQETSDLSDQDQGTGTPPEGDLGEESLPERVVSPTKESLKCLLTDLELKDLGITSARVGAQITQKEAELQAVKSQFKAEIDKLQAQRNECDQKINNGWEYRMVECEIVKDYRDNTVTVIRNDTGEMVRTRTMESSELQRSLDLQ